MRNAVAFEVNDHSHQDARKAGAYSFMVVDGQRVGITHACPCGCGRLSALWFRGSRHFKTDGKLGDEWDVVGEWPKVTLTPSIGMGRGDGPSGGFHWHGYLTAGEWREG